MAEVKQFFQTEGNGSVQQHRCTLMARTVLCALDSINPEAAVQTLNELKLIQCSQVIVAIKTFSGKIAFFGQAKYKRLEINSHTQNKLL